MYQVIQTRGTDEPWWFFENWKKMIVAVQTVATLDEAQALYRTLCDQLAVEYTHEKEKDGMVAFWNDGDTEYCIPCEEDLQRYYGVLVMKDDAEVIEMGEGGSRG